MSAVTFGLQNIFSLASRERCMTNLMKFRLPLINKKGVQPTATAAVLVPLCGINDVPSLLYTVRSAHLKSHSGQISFPGGKTDNNETPTETALRETQEEIGLSPGKIDVWGCGQAVPGGKTDINDKTPTETALRETQEEIGLLAGKIDVWGYCPVIPTVDYKTLVTPVVGCIEDLEVADLRLNKSEVNEVFTVPLEKLCDPKIQFHNQFSEELIVPVFMIDEFKIWGITAYMTHMVLRSLLPKDVYKSDWMNRKMKFKF